MFEGIFAPVPTPFDEEGEVAWTAFAENLHRWGASPLDGVVVAGTNGEAALLDEEEKTRAFTLARETLPASKKVIAGTGGESLRSTLRLNDAAQRGGADAVLVLNPSYFKGAMDEKTLEHYYLQVAESSSLPVLIYNMPRNTTINLGAALVARLSRHPNIVGIKDSSGNITQIGAILAGSEAGFAVFAGSAGFLLPALLLGAAGGTLALANIMPRACAELRTLYLAGKLEEAARLQLSIIELNRAVTEGWGVPGLKAALDMLGFYGGPPRLPLRPLGARQREALQELMKPLGLL